MLSSPRVVAFITFCLVGPFVTLGCRNALTTDLARLVDARRLASDTLVHLTKSADAGNRAVMAESDDASAEFAREAKDATDAVSRDSAELARLLTELEYPDEIGLLEEFDRQFAAYRALDTNILELAVENTNLKAQRLSFGPAQQEADAFRDAIQAVAPSARADQSLRLQMQVATAIAAVREVQILQAPHIAESDEAAMTRLETRAAAAEAAARRALTAMAALIPPTQRPRLAQATSALDRFMAVNAEIVALSRRNSNVRSLALSLGEKRSLTATCEERLRALQDALAKRGFTGTR